MTGLLEVRGPRGWPPVSSASRLSQDRQPLTSVEVLEENLLGHHQDTGVGSDGFSVAQAAKAKVDRRAYLTASSEAIHAPTR